MSLLDKFCQGPFWVLSTPEKAGVFWILLFFQDSKVPDKAEHLCFSHETYLYHFSLLNGS